MNSSNVSPALPLLNKTISYGGSKNYVIPTNQRNFKKQQLISDSELKSQRKRNEAQQEHEDQGNELSNAVQRVVQRMEGSGLYRPGSMQGEPTRYRNKSIKRSIVITQSSENQAGTLTSYLNAQQKMADQSTTVIHDPSSTSTIQSKFKRKQLSLDLPSQRKVETIIKHPMSNVLQNGVERKSVTIQFNKKKEKQQHEAAKSAGHQITISFNENPSKAQKLTSIREFEVQPPTKQEQPEEQDEVVINEPAKQYQTPLNELIIKNKPSNAGHQHNYSHTHTLTNPIRSPKIFEFVTPKSNDRRERIQELLSKNDSQNLMMHQNFKAQNDLINQLRMSMNQLRQNQRGIPSNQRYASESKYEYRSYNYSPSASALQVSQLNITGYIGSQHAQIQRQLQQRQNSQLQIAQTLFVIDCQTLGLLDQQNLSRRIPDFANRCTYSESQIVDIIIQSIHTYSAKQNKGHQLVLPKLEEDLKTIVNTIKAQQRYQKPLQNYVIDTLVIEIDNQDYRDNLLAPLYQYFGNNLIENIKSNQSYHKIQSGTPLQSIAEYNEKLMRLQDEKQNDNQYNSYCQQAKQLQLPMIKQELAVDVAEESNQPLKQTVVTATSLQMVGRQQSTFALLQNENSEAKQTFLKKKMPSQRLDKPMSKLFKSGAKFNLQSFVKNSIQHECVLYQDLLQKTANQSKNNANQRADSCLGNDISSIIKTRDSSILKFSLFCSQIGIIDNPTTLLKLFFNNVFIMINNSSNTDDTSKEDDMHRINQLNIELMNHRKQTMSQSASIQQLNIQDIYLTTEEATSSSQSKPAMIKIYHQPYLHHQKCKINKALKIYNLFVQLTFKNKFLFLSNQNYKSSAKVSLSEKELDKLYHLAKIMEIPLPHKTSGQAYSNKVSRLMEFFKMTNNLCNIKEMLLRFLSQAFNSENGISVNFQDYVISNTKGITIGDQKENQSQLSGLYSQNFTYKVGLGNNHSLINHLLKSKWWLKKVTKLDQAQICWTQWRKQKKCQDQLPTAKLHHKYSKILEMIENDNFNLCFSNETTIDKTLYAVRQQINSLKKRFQKLYNKLEFNHHLNNKKALFFNMSNYYKQCCEGQSVFETLPLTFHIRTGTDDPKFLEFKRHYDEDKDERSNDQKSENIWIIKPGENSNRGCGIVVETKYSNIENEVHQGCHHGRTIILQKYISSPLLYKNRKFDIRCFALVTSINGQIKAYFYKSGYIRTASKEYTLAPNQLYNKFIHLVNDAVQKHCEDYGRYETANKLSYSDFQKYLSSQYPLLNINLERDILSQVQKIVTDTIRATFHLLDTNRRANSFELFGYDFMFDTDFRPYLIEVNSNPSLECSSSLLSKLFYDMIENTFQIVLDPLFSGPPGFIQKKLSFGLDFCPINKFELIFDERIDGPNLLEKLKMADSSELQEIENSILNDEANGEQDENEEAIQDQSLEYSNRQMDQDQQVQYE